MYRVFLIGYMGVGKTSIGKRIAKQTGLSFIDLDVFIQNRFHKSMSDLFAEHGEEGFRRIEHNCLAEVAQFEDVVISCGGGTPCFMDNMALMLEAGTTFYIAATTDELVARLLASKGDRPLLKGKTPEELTLYVEEHIASRLPFYEQAHHTIFTPQLRTISQLDEVVERIVGLLHPL